jgi:hypothetical protein
MLLDEIISTLSDEKGSLHSALLATKVLLHKIGKKDLASWVTHELKGYPDENVPDYRVISAEIHAHVTSLAWQYTDYVLPTMHLKQAQRENLTRSKCRMSISSIEESTKAFRDHKQKLIRQLSPEYASLFQKNLTPGTNIISLWCEVNMMQVESVLTEVRTRLLEFMLELSDAVGADIADRELFQKASTIDTAKIFHTTIFNPGTVILGSENFQVVNQKDDIDGLIEVVGQLGFAQGQLEGKDTQCWGRGDKQMVYEGATGSG